MNDTPTPIAATLASVERTRDLGSFMSVRSVERHFDGRGPILRGDIHVGDALDIINAVVPVTGDADFLVQVEDALEAAIEVVEGPIPFPLLPLDGYIRSSILDCFVVTGLEDLQ